VTPAQLRRHCLGFPGAEETFPFGRETSVFKVRGKMFALSALEREPLQVSVKCEPELGEQLRGTYDEIEPGYHLNKRHWLTVTCGGAAPDELVRELVMGSYDLVA
jgi:predicted DNA-binding protein (MmcQ/YjbR family)